MKCWIMLSLGLFTYMNSLTQEIYITNFDNELKILDVSNFSTVVSANFFLLSMVHPAMCGLSNTLSNCNNFSNAFGSSLSVKSDSKERFSYSSTSKPAPIIFPLLIAWTKSEVTTHLPRAVFNNQNVL